MRRVNTTKLRVWFPALLGAISAGTAHADSISIRPAGDAAAIYRWSADKCGDQFIPDAPARAFRRADGQVSLIATHKENWSLVGPDFSSLRPVCRSSLSSSGLPTTGTGELWIEATYTSDGKNVAALVSEDLTQEMKTRGCKAGAEPGRCWINNILAARSTDMGQTFTLLPVDTRTVASIATDYKPSMSGRFGVFTTSNIVPSGGAYFMMSWAQGSPLQVSGNCLFRTQDPFNPAGWRAWNGSDFSVDMRAAKSPEPCTPLGNLPNEVRSISFVSAKQKWVAVFASRQKLAGDNQAIPGFYYSESDNLKDWGPSRRIMPAPTVAREGQSETLYAYPSLIDPSSPSRNFETLSEHALLFYTVHHLKNGKGTMNRDLFVTPVSVGW